MAPGILHLPSPLSFLHTSSKSRPLFTTFATETEANSTPPDPDSITSPPSDDFDSRLTRIRFRSGTGKKAEIRKARKNKGSATGSGSTVFLPPVPLKEPKSGGLKVEFGFTPYSEAVNGRIAGLGLVALIAVELATGKSVISYHSPSVIILQVYFMAVASALFLKFEKEKVSVWPPSANK